MKNEVNGTINQAECSDIVESQKSNNPSLSEGTLVNKLIEELLVSIRIELFSISSDSKIDRIIYYLLNNTYESLVNSTKQFPEQHSQFIQFNETLYDWIISIITG